MRKRMKRYADLLEVARALRLARAQLAFGNDRQKQCREDGDDRNDHEQLDQRESTPLRTMFKSRHQVRSYTSISTFRCFRSFTALWAKAQS